MSRAFLVMAALFVLSALWRQTLQPNGGHTWRQSSTLAMSLSFAQEWEARGAGALDFLLYPRLLDRGETSGIVSCEFPLLNVLTGPFFLVLPDQAACWVSSTCLLLLNLLVAWFYLPRFMRAWGAELPPETCLALWCSFFALAGQSVIFMPEGLAFPLTIAGMAIMLEGGTARVLVGALSLSLGVAVKPTMVVVLAAGVAAPWIVRGSFRETGRLAGLGAVALAFPAWWYGVHAAHLRALAPAGDIYATAAFHPFEKLMELGPKGIGLLLFQETHSDLFVFGAGWLFVAAALWVRETWPLVLYIASLVFCMALDGSHILMHRYYFMGSSAFALVVAARTWTRRGIPSWLRIALGVLLLVGLAFNVRTNLWCWAHDSRGGKVDRWAMGKEVAGCVEGDALVLTDDIRGFPYKLLFIGRNGRLMGTQVYEKGSRGRRVVRVASMPPPAGFPAPKIVERGGEKWYVTVGE